MTKVIRVLSFPSRHPYTSKFNNYSNSIRFVNPDTDYFENKGKFTKKFLHTKHPPNTYDIVHIHFSFDHVPLRQFIKTLEYFREHRKPIVWTCHSRTPQRIKNYENNQYQKTLFLFADKIISPTLGCASWIRKNWGNHNAPISIIPLGFMAHPKLVRKISKRVKKNQKLFTMLIGNFRENREFIHSINAFLKCNELKNIRLQLIFKPVSETKTNDNIRQFMRIINHPRIISIQQSNVPNETLIKAFVRSHSIILPYLWGTHSGQLELARDCGCHVSISNVGYYKEQWDEITFWQCPDNNWPEWEKNYLKSLIKISKEKMLKPAGNVRIREFNQAVSQHTQIYQDLINKL